MRILIRSSFSKINLRIGKIGLEVQKSNNCYLTDVDKSKMLIRHLAVIPKELNLRPNLDRLPSSLMNAFSKEECFSIRLSVPVKIYQLNRLVNQYQQQKCSIICLSPFFKTKINVHSP